MAYNMHQNNTCELVPQAGSCNETKEQEGSIFVHLSECRDEVPWAVGRRNWTEHSPCISWIPFEALYRGRNCPPEVFRSPNGWACVTISAHKGMYLPGFYSPLAQFRIIDEDSKPVWCYGYAGYGLVVAPECRTAWLPYTVGNPIPPKALQVSTWKDGEPIYIVGTLLLRTAYIGYYLPSANRTFILKGGLHSPNQVDILALL